MSSFPQPDHDHSQCQSQALALAEAVCRQQGGRLTDIRRQVLALLWEGHQPLTAYDILNRLNQRRLPGDGETRKAGTEKPGTGKAAAREAGIKDKPMAPAAVYRALEFLIGQGLVHRLASLNAFVGCTHPDRQHGAQFLICRQCHSVAEVQDEVVARDLQAVATRLGFVISAPLVEIEGLCPRCQPETGQGPVGQPETGQGPVGQPETGQGPAGQPETGQGPAGQGKPGQGPVRPGKGRHLPAG